VFKSSYNRTDFEVVVAVRTFVRYDDELIANLWLAGFFWLASLLLKKPLNGDSCALRSAVGILGIAQSASNTFSYWRVVPQVNQWFSMRRLLNLSLLIRPFFIVIYPFCVGRVAPPGVLSNFQLTTKCGRFLYSFRSGTFVVGLKAFLPVCALTCSLQIWQASLALFALTNICSKYS
jgi:hypothetical protein